MRSSQRSRMAAGVVFILIAFVVLGGMAWATKSSFELAKKNAMEAHERPVSRALWQMDSHIGGILNSEASRSHTDYLRVHELRGNEVVSVYAAGGAELDVTSVIVHSPLVESDPPREWMELFFQWYPLRVGGALTSPQVPDEEALWPLENLRAGSMPAPRARTWAWLRTVLPGLDLHERVAAVCAGDHAIESVPGGSNRLATLTVGSGAPSAAAGEHSRLSHEYDQRKQSLGESQVGYLPPEACVDARGVRGVRETWTPDSAESAEQQTGDVELTIDPITPFWLGVGPDGGRKLAFVRECHLGRRVFYQGFVGDWNLLRPELLNVVKNVFPEGTFTELDLVPVLDDQELSPTARGTQMSTLPVRLVVPDIPGGASAAAWREIRGTVITTWIAAAAVLVVAGVGLRNLVALTERRMQFAYAVTHELRTPLTTFRLYSDMLVAGLVPDGSQQEYLQTLDRESQRLSNLVEDVLEYARLENHRVKLSPQDTDGPSLLRGVRETLEKRCAENGIEALTENVVANGRPLRTDVELVQRIAGVLVNNACRHARGADRATVLVRLDGDDTKLYLDVIDSGPGIDRADARTIFKPFQRGSRADTAAHGGIGLGLALARSWASLLGGRLELAARHHPQYGGAHFRLTIPPRIPA